MNLYVRDQHTTIGFENLRDLLLETVRPDLVHETPRRPINVRSFVMQGGRAMPILETCADIVIYCKSFAGYVHCAEQQQGMYVNIRHDVEIGRDHVETLRARLAGAGLTVRRV